MFGGCRRVAGVPGERKDCLGWNPAAVAAAYPDVRVAVRAQRAFLARAVRFLVAEAGIRQFLDIGTGLPSADTHQVAQMIAPQSRVVYVDNDRCKSGCAHMPTRGAVSPNLPPARSLMAGHVLAVNRISSRKPIRSAYTTADQPLM